MQRQLDSATILHEPFPSGDYERVKYSLKVIKKELAKRPNPPTSADKFVLPSLYKRDSAGFILGLDNKVVEDEDATIYLWTAAMVLGMRSSPTGKFNQDAIYWIEKSFGRLKDFPKDQLGFFSTFSNTSLYETKFKQYVDKALEEIKEDEKKQKEEKIEEERLKEEQRRLKERRDQKIRAAYLQQKETERREEEKRKQEEETKKQEEEKKKELLLKNKNLLDERFLNFCWKNENMAIGSIKSMLDEGADIDYQDNQFGFTPLMAALDIQQDSTAAYLLKNGANPFLKNKLGKTAIDFASPGSVVFKTLKAKQKEKELNQEPMQVKLNREFHEEVASISAQAKKIRSLIDKGAFIDYQDSNGYSTLMLAVDTQNDRIVQYLLRLGANPLLKNKYGERASDMAISGTPIFEHLKEKEILAAITRKLIKPLNGYSQLLFRYVSGSDVRALVIDRYIDMGASLNYQNSKGLSVLMIIVDKGNEAIAEYLLKCGANPLLKNSKGKIASDLASKNSGIYRLLKGYELIYLTEDGQEDELDDLDDTANEIPRLLQLNIQFHEEIVSPLPKTRKLKELLNNGADIDYQNQEGYTALMLATDNKNEQIVEYLLRLGANPLLQNKDGETAKDLSSRNSFLFEILSESEILLKGQSLPPNVRYSLLMHNHVGSSRAEINKIDEFIKLGAEIDYVDSNKFTALMIAVNKGNESVAEFMLRCGANPILRNSSNKIASDYTSRHSEIYNLLKGYEILFYARDSDLNSLKLLLDADPALIDFKGQRGYTALLVAIQQNNLAVVEYLLLQGADLSIKCNDGQGALELASGDVKLKLIQSKTNSKTLVAQPRKAIKSAAPKNRNGLITDFSAEHYLKIAKIHDQGDGATRDIVSAITFYEKACDLNNKEAACRLGELYLPNFEASEPIPSNSENHEPKKDARKAFNYYVMAARQGDITAFEAMVKIVEQLDDDKLRYLLGQISFDVFAYHFLALTNFKKLADKNVADAVKQVNAITRSNPEHAYLMAKLYEDDIATVNYLQKACEYYSIAVQHDHAASREGLEVLAKSGNSEAQYVLAVEYYHRKCELDKAINLAMCAADQQHAKAMTYLFETNFNVDQYLMIAKKFDHGDGVKINIHSAVAFYEKASAWNNKEASRRLGELYDPGLELSNIISNQPQNQDLEKDAYKSFSYYLMAARQRDIVALEAMVKILEHFDDEKLQFSLGKIYLDVFANHLLALTCFKKSADKNVVDAVEMVSTLTRNNPEYAYIIAKLYEEDVVAENHLQNAYIYYAVGAHDDHAEPRKELVENKLDFILNCDEISGKELTKIGEMYYDPGGRVTRDYARAKVCFDKACIKGCETANYYLGKLYQNGNGVERNLVASVRYYQIAYDKGFVLANNGIDDILNSDELTLNELKTIASMYHNGSDGIEKRYLRAIMFYQKASELGDQAASLHLGSFFQNEHESVPKNLTLSFRFFLQAAKLGNQDALTPLERLGDEVSAENQLSLSNLYATFFHNNEKADFWRTKAIEVEHFDIRL